MKKLLFLIFFIFFYLFASVKSVSAAVLFQDNFEDGDYNGWTIHGGVWSVKEVAGSKRFGTTVIPTGTVFESTAGDVSWTDYVYEVDMIALQGTDKNVIFRVIDENNKYGIHMASYNVICIERWVNGNFWDSCKGWPFSNNVVYHLKAVLQGTTIKFYVDNQLAIDFNDTVSPITHGRIGLRIGTGADAPSEVYFDNVIVTSLEPSPTPTPTPTPLPPVILLPGLGGSWNHEEIFLGSDQPQSAWYETPFRDDYDGLLQTLQNAGYTLNQDLFVFYYDWLKPIDQSANDLKSFIESKVNPSPGTKIDLVGHSLGGLVARTYIQRNSGTHQVDQLITLGSPHKGAPQIYKAWEGAELNGLLGDKERIGAGILLRLRGFNYSNLVQGIQTLVPSLKDLLFIENYLKDENENQIEESEMSQRNDWLRNLGVPQELKDHTSTIVGTSFDTPRWLKVKPRSPIDERLGRWQDGKVVDEETADGDKIVLSESAEINGANVIILAGLDHGDLVKTESGQKKILELLGIPAGAIVEQPEIPFEPALVFTVASPATLRVTDPSGRRVGAGIDPPEIPNATFSTQEKIIIIPQALEGNYQIEITAEGGGGDYRLLVGLLTENGDYWREYQGKVSPTIPGHHVFFAPQPEKLKSYLLTQSKATIFSLKKNFNKQKITPKLRGKIENKLAVIQGNINAAIELLQGNDITSANIKIEKALMEIFGLEELLNGNEQIKTLLAEPLKEIKDYLLQAYEF